MNKTHFFDTHTLEWDSNTREEYNKSLKQIKKGHKIYQIGNCDALTTQLKREINLYLTGEYVNRSSSANEITLFERNNSNTGTFIIKSLIKLYLIKQVLETLTDLFE